MYQYRVYRNKKSTSVYTKGSMNKHMQTVHHSGGGAVYAFGMIGAAVYYLQHADSLTTGAWGLLKAVLWPAFFVSLL